MSREKKITIALSLTREDWIEVVHALGSKWEVVDHYPDHSQESWIRKWARDMKRLYNHVQKRVEAEGIEC